MLQIFIQDSLIGSQVKLISMSVLLGGSSAFYSLFSQHPFTRQPPLWFIDIAFVWRSAQYIDCIFQDFAMTRLWFELTTSRSRSRGVYQSVVNLCKFVFLHFSFRIRSLQVHCPSCDW